MKSGANRSAIALTTIAAYLVVIGRRDEDHLRFLVPAAQNAVTNSLGVECCSDLGRVFAAGCPWCGESAEYELTHGELHAYHAALEEIGQMWHVHFTDPEVLAGLRREYGQKTERDRAVLNDLLIEKRQLHKEELQ